MKMISQACTVLLMLTLATGVALANTYHETINVTGGGTFTYTDVITETFGRCIQTREMDYAYNETYNAFSYTIAGVTTQLTGSESVYTNYCGVMHATPITWWLPSAELIFTPLGQAGGSAAVAPGLTGYVDPKFLVVGVTYAPPGPSTNTFVQYLNSTFVGNTESLSTSFGSGSTSSITLTYGPSIPLVANGKITNTFSTTNSETTKNTSTVTTSIQVSQGEKTFGTGNYFAPVDNDYDLIWVWLNPVAIFTTFSGNSVNSVVWNGYGFDGTDQSGMDIVPIPLGYLNGHFGTIPPDIQTSLNRTWAADQTWPPGDGPGLTSADLAQIASTDPFSVSTYGLDFIGYVPPSPQTSDDRFTLSMCSSVSSFNYLQANPSVAPGIYTCGLTYTNLSTQAQEISTSYSQTFSTDISFSGTGFLKNFSADLKNSSTLTWTTDAQSSITTSTTSTANLSAQGPPCNNVILDEGPCVPVYDASGNQPTQFEVYQDNMFGTFMFAPVHYY
jgi:hypothetical protein